MRVGALFMLQPCFRLILASGQHYQSSNAWGASTNMLPSDPPAASVPPSVKITQSRVAGWDLTKVLVRLPDGLELHTIMLMPGGDERQVMICQYDHVRDSVGFDSYTDSRDFPGVIITCVSQAAHTTFPLRHTD